MVKKTSTGTLIALGIGAYLAYKKWWAAPDAPSTAGTPQGTIKNDTVSPLLAPMAQTSRAIAAATQFAAKAVDDMTGKSDWGKWT